MRPFRIGHRLLVTSLVALVLRACPAGAAEPGLRVQVDPETGTYSLPAPMDAAENAETRTPESEDVVITPGRSPAGGFKATLRRESELRGEQP